MRSVLKDHKRIMVDTAPLIYYIEEHPAYSELSEEFFGNTDEDKESFIFSSVLTLTEVLIQPLRKNKAELVEKYKEILLNSDDFVIYPIDMLVAEKAAELRATYNIKTPDAIQLAVGIENDASLFVTNDKDLKRVEEIEVLVLDDYV